MVNARFRQSRTLRNDRMNRSFATVSCFLELTRPRRSASVLFSVLVFKRKGGGVNIIVVNPKATRLRKDDRIRNIIRRDFSQFGHIIDCDEQDDVIKQLNQLAQQGTITKIYVVGGDGTFNHVLNWIIGQPTQQRPSIVSVGGGEFCYMARFHGFKSRNPLKNLSDIFHRKLQLTQRNWQPVCMQDSGSDIKRHAAVFANGIICDMIDWYEEKGKVGW